MSDTEPKPHRVLTVLSRKSIELPLADVMRDGQIEIFAQVEEQGLLFLQFRRGRLIVTAGKFIGLIPLTPEISIDVKPKMPVRNLAHVLEVSRASLATLDQAHRLYDTEATQEATILGFLLRNLMDAITPIRSHGLLKDYVSHSYSSSDPRGHINMVASLHSHWSKGQKHRVSVDRFEQTSDVSPNRLLRHALEYALTVLARSGCDQELLKLGNSVHLEFPVQIGPFRPTDYSVCLSLVQRQGLPPSRAYYYRALEIALLILSKRSVSLDRQGSEVELQTFILDFEVVFESYLRRVLELRAPGHIIVRDGNHDGKRPLYDNRPQPTAEPDIVLQCAGVAPLIAEVKYKDKPDRSDINQAVTYAVCYRTEHVVLLHQARTAGIRGRYDIGVINGIRVDGYAFDLDTFALDAEEAQFVACLSATLPPASLQLVG